MPRAIRAIAVGVPHHITQRGNSRQDVFFSDEERMRYLEWLSEYSRRYQFDIHAYCLMTNHIHIIGTPRQSNSMSRTIQMTQMRHSQAVNISRGRSGHLWQSRYYSTILDEAHLYRAVRYVEQNPVRAKMVKLAEEYPWSSAACHCGLRTDPILSAEPKWNDELEDWRKLLRENLDDETVEELRKCTRVGRPYAEEERTKELSKIVGRALEKRPVGRPKLQK